MKRKPTLQESMGTVASPASGGSALTPRKRNMSEKIEQLEAVTKALQVQAPYAGSPVLALDVGANPNASKTFVRTSGHAPRDMHPIAAC